MGFPFLSLYLRNLLKIDGKYDPFQQLQKLMSIRAHQLILFPRYFGAENTFFLNYRYYVITADTSLYCYAMYVVESSWAK